MTSIPLADYLPVTELPVRHLCDWRIDFDVVEVIETPLGRRTLVSVGGGTFEGPRLRGTILPIGGDWVLVGTDGVARIDARAVLRTHDGATILVRNTGRTVLSDEATERRARGEVLHVDQVHARSSPQFETAVTRYAWINGVTTIAVNEIGPRHVFYRVYEVT